MPRRTRLVSSTTDHALAREAISSSCSKAIKMVARKSLEAAAGPAAASERDG